MRSELKPFGSTVVVLALVVLLFIWEVRSGTDRVQGEERRESQGVSASRAAKAVTLAMSAFLLRMIAP